MSYFYSFNDNTQDANGAYRRFVDVTLNTGSGGAITGATCNARCPVQTYFIGYATYAINGRQNVKIGGYSGPTGLADLKVSSSAVATRNPRLIMVVLDHSASMLESGGGAVGLAPAVVQFLDFFDTSSDTIGIVSFGSNARLEMPMTTNFIIAGTNNLIDGYETNLTTPGLNVPGIDPESVVGNMFYQQFYTTTGIRRLKFGGQTAADDGIRLALEQMMANPGFNDPDVVKYMVIFTDGKWNASRTLFSAPGYTNEIIAPRYTTAAQSNNNVYVTNAISALSNSAGHPLTNGQAGIWDVNLANDGNLLPVPSLGRNPTNSDLPFVTNAMGEPDEIVAGVPNDYSLLVNDHTNDVWQSTDTSGQEPLYAPTTSATIGHTMSVTNTTFVGTNPVAVGTNLPGSINYYTHDLDVWLTPGSIAYVYNAESGGSITASYISDYTKPTKHVYINLASGNRLELVVPGYITDGLWYDGIDLNYPDNSSLSPSLTTYPRFRQNNYQEGFMWCDDTTQPNVPTYGAPYYSTSLQRELMFRNYPNLLTGFIIYQANDATAPYISTRPAGQQGIEPLISDSTNSAGAIGAPRPLNASGAYYPGAGFYWPFGGDTNSTGYVTNAVGVDYDPTYALLNPNDDPDPQYSEGDNGGSRHDAYSINMLSTNAAPQWYGELFYNSINGGGPTATSGTANTSASQIMHSADWQVGAPAFMVPLEVNMYSEPNHDANIVGLPSVWRPLSFNGSNFPTAFTQPQPTLSSTTGGYVMDGSGHVYANAMAWSGRPTHYYDFTKSSWEPIADNHTTNIQALPIGNWKAGEYAWHARALGVTIYTVGYGTHVTAAQCSFLASIANATNVITPGTPFDTNVNTYNPSQPIGQQFYATTSAQISNDFYSIGQAINAALTQ